jgi:putative membrane protein
MKVNLNRFIKLTNPYENREEIILRDHLAIERTRLSNERTLLSYIRTSLYLMLGGIAFLGMQGLEEIKVMGYFSLSLSFIILVIGIARFFQLKKQIKKMYDPLVKKHIEEVIDK